MENTLKKFLWTIKTSGLIKGKQQLSPTATFTHALRAKGPDDVFTLMSTYLSEFMFYYERYQLSPAIVLGEVAEHHFLPTYPNICVETFSSAVHV